MLPCSAQPGPVTLQTFRTSSGSAEKCVHGLRIPGGTYSESDAELEREYCSIDFYATALALCPKMWSTSPATIVYDITGGRFRNNQAGFENQACPKSGSAIRDAVSELAMFKMSMNEKDTSGTFSAASLLYCHLSRYFATEVQVPVSVLRTIDKNTHDRRVIEPGLRYTVGKSSLHMIHAGWKHYAEAVNNAKAVESSPEFLTSDGNHLYGVLLRQTGARYGPEVNGTRAGGWGAGQNKAFQRTPPFLALRVPKPLLEAIREGTRQARLDPAVAKASTGGHSDAQMIFWMRELTEIVLLDFILGQQDRIGNIDFEDRWYWVRQDKLECRPASGKKVPNDLTAARPLLIKRTWLNDNDAGVRKSHPNFAERTHMLDGVAHFSATTYRQLIWLDRGLPSQGALHRHLSGNYGLSARDQSLMLRRTREAADILQRACRERRLRFDLEPQESLRKGQASESPADCEANG